MAQAVILFDGVCNLCSWSVRFILRRDRAGYFRFAALQSPSGQRLLSAHGLSRTDGASVVLVEGERVYLASDAALRIARHLGAAWPLFSLLLRVPRPVRDPVYSWVAAHRYQWFGQRDECLIAVPGLGERFLDGELR